MEPDGWGASLPTAVRWIEREYPPADPAGFEQCDLNSEAMEGEQIRHGAVPVREKTTACRMPMEN
jgi:hypothetical protein